MPTVDASTQSPSTTEMCVLRIEVDSDWPIRDLGTLCDNIHMTFGVLAGFEAVFSDLFPPPISDLTPEEWNQEVSRRHAAGFFKDNPDGFDVRRLIDNVNPLMIRSVRMSSPGWLEVIGAFNPLKIIADFFTAYRAENTKRMKLKLDAVKHREELVMNLTIGVLKLIPKRELEANQQLSVLAQHLIPEIFPTLQAIAVEKKVKKLEIITPDE